MGSLIATEVSDYLQTLIPPRHPELEAMESYAHREDFPIIGPVAMFVVYPYLKRFTWLCHFWLGACLALAPVVVLLDTPPPGLAAVREKPDAGVAKHIEYAFTWFALAATALGLWLGLNLKRSRA